MLSFCSLLASMLLTLGQKLIGRGRGLPEEPRLGDWEAWLQEHPR